MKSMPAEGEYEVKLIDCCSPKPAKFERHGSITLFKGEPQNVEVKTQTTAPVTNPADAPKLTPQPEKDTFEKKPVCTSCN